MPPVRDGPHGSSLLIFSVFSVLASTAAGAPAVHPVLLPGAQEPIRKLFERLGPAWEYDSIDIDHDYVLAKVCGTSGSPRPCFQVRLDPPRPDCPRSMGPFCVQFPDGLLPPGAHEVLDAALKSANTAALWSDIPVAEPPHPVRELLAPWRDPVRVALKRVLLPEWLILALLLALGLCVARYWDPEAPQRARGRTDEPAGISPRRRPVELVLAPIVAVIAFVWLKRVNPPSGTTGEVFLVVVDCLMFGRCQTVGAGSSVVLANGAIWPELLTAVRFAGGNMSAVHTAVLVFLALGAGVVFLMAWRLARPVLATPAATLAIGLLGFLSLASPLIDCSITFLFSTSAAACLFLFARSGRAIPLAVGAVLASHAVNSHTSAVSILPALLFLPPLAGRSPVRAVVIAAASYMLATAMTSWQTIIGNWIAINTAGLLLAVVLGVAVLPGVGAWLNPWFRRLSMLERSVVAVAALIGPHVAGMLLLLAIQHPGLPRYLPPVVAPVSIAAAATIAWIGSRFPSPWSKRCNLAFVLPMAIGLGVMSQNSWRTDSGPSTGLNGAWPPPGASIDVIEAMPEARQLTHQGLLNLNQLVDRASHGALGDDVADANFGFSYSGLSADGAVRFQFRKKDGSRMGFELLRPPVFGTAVRPKYFALMPDDAADVQQIERVTSLLDEIFVVNPWNASRISTPAGDELKPVSLGFALAGFFFVLASLAAGFVLIGRARPES